MLEELYGQYGKLLIQREVLDGRILEIKRQIAKELSISDVPKVQDNADSNKEDIVPKVKSK